MIRQLQAGLREQIRQAEADWHEAEILMRRASREREWAELHLAIAERLGAAMGIGDDEAEEAPAVFSGSEFEGSAVDAPAHKPGTTIAGIRGPDFWRRIPDVDEETGDLSYDVRVVSGKGNTRERARAAARVYGYRLKESSLAQAIFRTGETRAASPESIRGSLGGLVRYGGDWRRDRGWLVYCGDELEPDWDTLRELACEGKSCHSRGRKEEGPDQIELSE